MAYIWQNCHQDGLKCHKTAQNHTDIAVTIIYNHLWPLGCIGTIKMTLYRIFRYVGQIWLKFGSFLTKLPLRFPQNVLKLLKKHKGTAVTIIYNHSWPLGVYRDHQSDLMSDFGIFGANLVKIWLFWLNIPLDGLKMP